MIILVPENSFKKRIEKWVSYKDFYIADALDRHDGAMREFGNRIECDELSPTPTLVLIATGGEDNKEAQIKKRRVNMYLDTWLNDEGLNIKLHYLVGLMVKSFKQTGEDCNIFLVMRKPIFYAYHEAIERHINEGYQAEIATSLTHKMEKKDQKAILTKEISKSTIKTLKECLKRVGKAYKIKPEEKLVLDDFDGVY